ncbi:hypothetical protein [Desulfogranum marinum]|uniref:hypothetical protein n=1 Tax=Desulfogranum marinum TaxID=453220 RepID=UPI0029C6BCC1|nr:hypothetical protein [Desulfogranum marinum]
MDNTLNDVFLDIKLPEILPEISITDGVFHFDIVKNGWVYLEDDEHHYYHMKDLEVEKIRQLWECFHEGNIDDILAEPWIEGIPAFNGDR